MGIVGLENNGGTFIFDRVVRDGFSVELSFEKKEPALQRSENRIFLAEEIANAKALR